MIPLIKHYVKAFFFDQNAAKRFLVGLGSLLASAGTAVLVFGFSTIAAWDKKTLLQHGAFALLTTLATMLPGPAIAKPPAVAAPDKGYVKTALLAGIIAGVVQLLILGLAFHSLGLNAHGWMLFLLPVGFGQGCLVWRVLQ